MTRQESLDRMHRQSLAANGYKVPPRELEDGPKGDTPRARAVKKTITLGLVLSVLWGVYRVATFVWVEFLKDRPAVEQRNGGETK